MPKLKVSTPKTITKTATLGKEWVNLQREQRHGYIEEFYKTGNLSLAEQFISVVKAPTGYGVYASAGLNYEYAVFGRDSIQFAEDVMCSFPHLSHEIILLLARLQGVKTNTLTEEEPGKIHHEYRSRYFNQKPISESANKILGILAAKWGGENNELCYFGSVDATPLFVSLVRNYCQVYGDQILAEQVTRRDGQTVTVRVCVREAAELVMSKVNSSEWNLLEFKRMNPNGLLYQAWKDSSTGYLHLSGEPANADDGIASVEVQGFAFDALYDAAELVAISEKEAEDMRTAANKLRDSTLEKLWLPDKKYFAVGLDRDSAGKTRQIATITSNAGQLLRSDMWATIDNSKFYTDPIVAKLMSPDFLTDAGLRSRSLEHVGLVDFSDYHGSQVTWPRDTFTVARGMAKLGYAHEAKKLQDAVLHAVSVSGEFYEFFMVDKMGNVKYRYRLEDPSEPSLLSFAATNHTEPVQAWTLSSVIDIVTRAKN